MSLSCPVQSEITSMSQADKAYTPTFLTLAVEHDSEPKVLASHPLGNHATLQTSESAVEHDESGNLSKEVFLKLLDSAKKEKRYLEQNAFSFQQLMDSVHREYCFVLQQYLYILREYTRAPDEKLRVKVQTKNQSLQDLLSCMGFLDEMIQAGHDTTMVEPTEEQRPFSYLRLAPVEKFQNIGSKYTDLKVELREQMANLSDDDMLALRKDMVDYSKEKNRAATNLLGVYAFLNLTAIGLLIYIFRSK